METKKCSKCGEVKTFTSYTKCGRGEKRRSYCKVCNKKSRDLYKSKPGVREKINKQANKHRIQKTKEDNRIAVYASARQRANQRGIEFTIKVEDIEIPTHCPILNIPIVKNFGPHGPLPNSPSLDRIDPNGGYVKGNIHIISNKANTMKSNASLEELILLGEWAKVVMLEEGQIE